MLQLVAVRTECSDLSQFRTLRSILKFASTPWILDEDQIGIVARRIVADVECKIPLICDVTSVGSEVQVGVIQVLAIAIFVISPATRPLDRHRLLVYASQL
jgi:hypothetical protein